MAQASVMAALCAATAIIAVVLPFGLRWRCWAQCPWAARLPLPPAGADRRGRRRRHDRVLDRRHGRFHDGRQ
ncbi:hypothetical protein I553_7830 [Mycobacterium xenopi 4042]|uniref:Uncharacterized protein n=1 Tax=Mycobacterium xenopi 4042 TaxID=1299334 RepID=X8AP86_MYCXE|nr:hypothetical protein I553_7830 [Mycobacterium xenopi 4042]